MNTYRVMFCCNDDRGNFTERVDAIEVGDEIYLAGPPKVLRFDEPTSRGETVRVGRRAYRCRGRDVWVGNICWDATSMVLTQARFLVRDLIAAGWTVEQHAEDGPFADLVPTRQPPEGEG